MKKVIKVIQGNIIKDYSKMLFLKSQTFVFIYGRTDYENKIW